MWLMRLHRRHVIQQPLETSTGVLIGWELQPNYSAPPIEEWLQRHGQ